MPINYTTLPIQIATMLRMARKIHALQIQQRDASNANYDRRLLIQANGLSTSDDQEAKVFGGFLAWLDGAAVPNERALFASLRAKIESQLDGLGKIIAEDLAASADERGRAWIDYEYDSDLTDGTIAIKQRHGLWGLLYRDMAAAANSQYITANAISFGSFTAGSGNNGTLTATSRSGASHVLTGTARVECVDDTVDRPQFRVTLTPTLPRADGVVAIEGDNLLTAGKSWEDGPTGLTMTLTVSGLAAPTEAGDNGNIFSSTSIASPKEADSNKGIFYITVTRQASAPIWLVEVYRDSARTEKVGRATTDGTTGTAVLTITCNGGSIITTTFDKAAANTALPSAGNSDADISFDIDTPHVGDFWTFTTTSDDAGNYATKIAQLWPATLPTSGSNLWTDANASSISMS
jgi:hypothetical protein